jgi:hypothetical protein
VTLHVDVVKNEWNDGFQVLVAQVFPTQEDVKVTTLLGTEWEEVLRRPIVDRTTGETVTVRNPERFLKVLGDAFDGSLFFVTSAHPDDAEHCHFHGDARRRIPFRRVGASQPSEP